MLYKTKIWVNFKLFEFWPRAEGEGSEVLSPGYPLRVRWNHSRWEKIVHSKFSKNFFFCNEHRIRFSNYIELKNIKLWKRKHFSHQFFSQCMLHITRIFYFLNIILLNTITMHLKLTLFNLNCLFTSFFQFLGLFLGYLYVF